MNKDKKNTAISLSEDDLEQAAGGYSRVVYKDGTEEAINADGSKYYKNDSDYYNTHRTESFGRHNKKQVHKLEGVYVEK